MTNPLRFLLVLLSFVRWIHVDCFITRNADQGLRLSAVYSNRPHGGETDGDTSSWKCDSKDTLTETRRDALIKGTGIALATVLGGNPPVSASETAVERAPAATQRSTIVVTGANSGIGKEACKRLAQQGYTLILACRTMDKALATAESLESYGGSLIPAECNLASMNSIQKFASSMPNLLEGNGSIDALCLNAGLARKVGATDVARTEDGFELTVGTNHFGHFYLNHLLLPRINPNGGRIVVTASGVHDPDSPGGAQGVPATLGDLRGLTEQGRAFEMVDGAPFNADKAYKDSKLCNVFFTRELQRRLLAKESTKEIVANCFNPGLIVSTGLFRDQNPFFTKLFDIVATDLVKVGETPAWGGGCLSYMATEVDASGAYYTSPPGSAKYGDLAYGREFTVSPVSKEAQNDATGTRLWELSAGLLGIPA